MRSPDTSVFGPDTFMRSPDIASYAPDTSVRSLGHVVR
jgi:hypothetical protein